MSGALGDLPPVEAVYLVQNNGFYESNGKPYPPQRLYFFLTSALVSAEATPTGIGKCLADIYCSGTICGARQRK